MTRCAAIIPARYASTRLPAKPLLKETGKYLIQHVYEQVSRAEKLDRVLVATDDERIAAAVREFGGEAVMTAKEHPSGTDRVAEAAGGLDARIIINVQGDEPDIDPALLDGLVEVMTARGSETATAAVPFRDEASLASPHVVKVVVGADGQALYFSRAPIPHGGGKDCEPLKHIGVYAYRREALLKLAALDPVPPERAERLEQLRVLYHGMAMHVIIWHKDHLGIDTREEYEAFVKRYEKGRMHP